jgi:hypothetical protein
MIKRLRRTTQRAIVAAGFVLLCQSTVTAEAYRFEGRPSGWSPSYVEQTVVAPCHAKISVRISGARYDHHADDVPIIIEYRAPGVSALSEPTDISVFQSKPENKETRTFTTNGHSSGCGSPWRIRIVPNRTSTREGYIVGDFSVGFVKTVSILSVEDAALLANQKSVTKNIGPTSGFHQGWVDVFGTWNHNLFGFPGPLPVKLTFSLVKPNGDIVAFDSGHSNHEENPCCSWDKMRLRFFIRENINGQWKLKITNDSGQDAMTIIPRATFTPSCQ